MPRRAFLCVIFLALAAVSLAASFHGPVLAQSTAPAALAQGGHDTHESEPVPPVNQEGRRIYEKGIGVSGEAVQARVGEGNIPVSAAAIPCATCHGLDGRGRPEGGVDPSDIRWTTLTKPYGHTHRGGREHPAFDAESLRRALTEGLDPAGNRLDSVMPRYAVSEVDVAALAAYLRALGHGTARGVGKHRVMMGIVVPGVGPAAQAGMVLRSMTTALMDEINKAGGIHGRHLHLVTIEAGKTPEATAKAVRRMIREHRLFALIAPFAPGAGSEIARVAREEGTPVIAPFDPFPGAGNPRDDVFHIFPETGRQMALLVRHARQSGDGSGDTVILHDGRPDVLPVAKRLARDLGDDASVRLYDGSQAAAGRIAAEINEKPNTRVLYLAAVEDFAPLAAGLTPHRPGTDLLLPGWAAGLVPVAVQAGWQGRILVGLPIDPSGIPPGTATKIQEVSHPFGFGGSHMAMQVMAYAAVELASEGMRRSGRALRADTFRAALEELENYDLGLGAPVSYRRNRRHGLDGIRVIELSLVAGRRQQTATWVTWD